MTTVRTRFEPAPSGSLHVGNALGGVFNWLWARKHNGTFILRIADTDRTRVTAEAIDQALTDLRWLGLDWDEGPEVGGPHEPYLQSGRYDLYRAAAAKLLDQQHAYRCYCTPDELEARRQESRQSGRPPGYDGRCRSLTDEQRAAFEGEGRAPLIRFRVPAGETRITDLVRGDVTFDHAHIADFGILRADGTPLYMLAAAYDDSVMGITHVIRGDDIFANTPKQILLMEALGATPPAYAHYPLLVGPDRAKLSKRHGATSIAAFRDMGILPEVMLNYVAILSWSVGDGVTERFTVPELIEAFDLSGVTRNPSAFDLVKLQAMNGERLRALPAVEVARRIEPFLVAAGIVTEPVGQHEREIIATTTPLIHERIQRLDEAPAMLGFFFADPEPDERAAQLLVADHAPTLQAAVDVLEKLDPFDAATIQRALNDWAEGAGIKKKVAFQPIRAAVTGSLVSPPLFESIELLGRETTLQRLRRALDRARA